MKRIDRTKKLAFLIVLWIIVCSAIIWGLTIALDKPSHDHVVDQVDVVERYDLETSNVLIGYPNPYYNGWRIYAPEDSSGYYVASKTYPKGWVHQCKFHQ